MTSAIAIEKPTTTTVEGGYLKRGDQIVRDCGTVVTVERWESCGSTDVAVFEADERYLIGIYEPVTVIGRYPERSV